MDHYPVILRFPDYHQINGIFVLNEDADDCTLSLQYEGTPYPQLRPTILKTMCQIVSFSTPKTRSAVLWCKPQRLSFGDGARHGQGLKAYKMRICIPTRMLDLVSIFAYESDVQPATVAQQQAYFQAWLKSF